MLPFNERMCNLRLEVFYALNDGYEWGNANRFNLAATDQRYDVLCNIVNQLRLTGTHRAGLVAKLVAIATKHNVVLPPEPGECWMPFTATAVCSGEQIRCL